MFYLNLHRYCRGLKNTNQKLILFKLRIFFLHNKELIQLTVLLILYLDLTQVYHLCSYHFRLIVMLSFKTTNGVRLHIFLFVALFVNHLNKQVNLYLHYHTTNILFSSQYSVMHSPILALISVSMLLTFVQCTNKEKSRIYSPKKVCNHLFFRMICFTYE